MERAGNIQANRAGYADEDESVEGCHLYLKGDRGERIGKYLVLIEIDSVETRDHYFPAPSELSAAAQQYFDQRSESQQALDAKLDRLVTPVGEIFTDYVVIAG